MKVEIPSPAPISRSFFFQWKANLLLLPLPWSHQLADRLEQRSNVFIMTGDTALEFLQLQGQLLAASHSLPQADKNAHNQDIAEGRLFKIYSFLFFTGISKRKPPNNSPECRDLGKTFFMGPPGE